MTTETMIREAIRRYHAEGIGNALNGAFRLLHCGSNAGRGVVILYAPFSHLEAVERFYAEQTGEPPKNETVFDVKPEDN